MGENETATLNAIGTFEAVAGRGLFVEAAKDLDVWLRANQPTPYVC